MKFMLTSILLMLGGCTITSKPGLKTCLKRTAQYQAEIDNLLSKDAESKKWEYIYLNEIRAAENNGDRPAYKFFVIEFLKLPRYNVPEWMRQEPGYVDGPSAQEISDMNIRLIIPRHD